MDAESMVCFVIVVKKRESFKKLYSAEKDTNLNKLSCSLCYKKQKKKLEKKPIEFSTLRTFS